MPDNTVVLQAKNLGELKENLFINILGYPIFTGKLNQIPTDKKLLINTINQYSYCVAEKDKNFEKALKSSDVLLPDGIAIVWAARLFTNKKIKKIAGADLHKFFLEKLNKVNGKVFYLGASDTTLKLIKEKLSIEYPNLEVGSYSPPYKPAFDQHDNDRMLLAVNSFKPEVVFVGMTAPKQENWAFKHFELLDTKAICSIGAVFDFYAGTVSRPKDIWINLGMEWFVRLLNEPKRMSKRYLIYGPAFIYIMVKKYFNGKILGKPSLN